MSDPGDLFGRMPRHRVGDLDDHQQRLFDGLVASLDGRLPRSLVDEDGRISGAFNYVLIDPEAGEPFVQLGDALSRKLPPRLREIVILETSRITGCEYEWRAHESVGRKVGLSGDELDELRDGRSPDSFTRDERLAREVVLAVLGDRDLPDELYRSAAEAFGVPVLWDVVTLAGYYCMMDAMLVAFRAPFVQND